MIDTIVFFENDSEKTLRHTRVGFEVVYEAGVGIAAKLVISALEGSFGHNVAFKCLLVGCRHADLFGQVQQRDTASQLRLELLFVLDRTTCVENRTQRNFFTDDAHFVR